MKNICSVLIVVTIVLVISIQALPQWDDKLEEIKEDMKKLFEGTRDTLKRTCYNNTNANFDSIRSMHEGKFDEIDQNTKCFIHCIFTAMGIVKNGELNVQAISGMLEKISSPLLVDRTKKTLEHCKNVVGKDPCDISLQLIKCAYVFDKETLDVYKK